MGDLIRKVQVNVPFRLLKEKYLSLVLRNHINPEIGIDGFSLDRYSSREFSSIARMLQEEGLSITLHAPFMDMVPGSPDSIMREATRQRLDQAFEMLDIFEPRSIVCHTGFHERYMSQFDLWLEASVETWRNLLEKSSGTTTKIMFENVYESDPGIHLALFNALDSPRMGFCFDIGHWNAFTPRVDVRLWFEALGSFLGQLHVHDNRGQVDDHLPVGQGNIDFESFFLLLKNFSGLIVTLEPHKEEDIFTSIEALDIVWPW
ncbi:MAG: sugar phosphate isomerase/epimerase family protein [Pseudomonadota bacterium]